MDNKKVLISLGLNKGCGGLRSAVNVKTFIIFLSVLDITQVLCVVRLLGC